MRRDSTKIRDVTLGSENLNIMMRSSLQTDIIKCTYGSAVFNTTNSIELRQESE